MTMEPLTPGITMVAEAMTPTKNNRSWSWGHGKAGKHILVIFEHRQECTDGKEQIKATAPLIPMDFFCVRSSLRSAWNSTGSPPKISPTKAIQVTKV